MKSLSFTSELVLVFGKYYLKELRESPRDYCISRSSSLEIVLFFRNHSYTFLPLLPGSQNKDQTISSFKNLWTGCIYGTTPRRN